MIKGRVVRYEQPQSHTGYYVAMVAIVGLLVLLCCYFCYFFIRKVREVSELDTPTPIPSSRPPKKETVAYPIQPVVRDSATAMAALCQQLPSLPPGGQVHPAGRSPDPRFTDTGLAQPPETTGGEIPHELPPDKMPVPAEPSSSNLVVSLNL